MRILFTPLAVGTHVFQQIPLAWACRSAGHDVRFAAQQKVVETINRAGLLAVSLGDSYDFETETARFLRENPDLIAGPDGRQRRTSGAPAGVFARPWVDSARAVTPRLVEFGTWWRPDLVVSDPMFYAGPLLAEVLGVPLVRLLWGPDWTKSGHGMGGYPDDGTPPPPWPDELKELFESHGARTEVDFAQFTIDPTPPSLQLPGLVNRATMRPTPFNGSGMMPDWVAQSAARPRVCFTWGSTTTLYLGDRGFLVPKILEAFESLDVELVLTIAQVDRDRIGAVPPGTRVVANLPLEFLLPTCSALVFQGGAGALVSSAVHGVPQVIIPLMADQPSNASLAAGAGTATVLDPDTMTISDISAAVASAVSGADQRAAADRVREEIRSLPTPAEMVGRLERLVREWSPPGVA